jgi:hypothetical protein
MTQPTLLLPSKTRRRRSVELGKNTQALRSGLEHKMQQGKVASETETEQNYSHILYSRKECALQSSHRIKIKFTVQEERDAVCCRGQKKKN